MAVRITHRRMIATGTTHEHIARLKGYDDAAGTPYDATREQWYEFVKNQNGVAYVQDALGRRASLVGRISSAGNRYVQTVRDNVWTDNLLALPLY
ncbi:MAG: hypothetical protein JWM87_1797 [Candidatus Eremiobacteraeota bacterium]|nr:hypothetical protein [Candidatus Eremiobacteraeota bacterium]